MESEPEVPAAPAVDLLEALKASVEAAKAGKPAAACQGEEARSEVTGCQVPGPRSLKGKGCPPARQGDTP